MDIIFVILTKYLIPLSILLRKIGFQVYYLELSDSLKIIDDNWFEKLKDKNIMPLPIESLPHIFSFSDKLYDPKMKVYQRTLLFTSEKLLFSLGKLFSKDTDVRNKLILFLHMILSSQMGSVTSKVNIWADAHQDRSHILIDLNFSGFLIPELSTNVKLIVIPVEIIANGIIKIVNGFKRVFKISDISTILEENKEHSQRINCKGQRNPKVAFIVHKGLMYGNLYEKNLFYSERIDSEFYPENILHLDYSGYQSPSTKLNWEHIGNHGKSWIKNIVYLKDAICCGFIHVRKLKHLFGLIIIARSYVIFKSFMMSLEKYPTIELALIDYEILCPKELLLAFEIKGIKTVAVQERFFMAKSNLYGTILNQYLCGSCFVADVMHNSPTYCVDNYVVVGQYRSDNLVSAFSSSPPYVMTESISKEYRIITALGFHTPLTWQESQLDPLLNWTAHKQFMDDMLRLSHDIQNVYIILRYKTIDWMELPVFSEIIQQIISSENIMISTDYSKPLISYDLCAHSDLVIAKHTSLADECLSVGIPVLFHEYTHNLTQIVSGAFDYNSTKIMCYNYDELLKRARIILNDTPNEMTPDYEYLKEVVYGGLGDGRVKERVHAFIDGLLAQEESI